MNQKEMIASLKEQKILLGIQSRFPHAGILEVLCPGWDLRRTQTIMEGAEYCDFRYEIKKA